MDYINVAEFLKQPEEVQKVLKDWMKDKYVKGDLAATHHGLIEVVIILEGFADENGRKGYYCITQHKKTPMWVAEYPNWLTPLFREDQLRKFIEEKTGGCNFFYTTQQSSEQYIFAVENESITYEFETNDLLQAYWQVACKIALDQLIKEDKHE